MTDQQILDRVIEKVTKEGGLPLVNVFGYKMVNGFPEKNDPGLKKEVWKKHLQQMVISENPIQYLKAFLE